jgi:hypothetical protein
MCVERQVREEMANIKRLERAGAIIHMISTIVLTIWLVLLVASLYYGSESSVLEYLFAATVVVIGLDYAVGRKIKSERLRLGLATSVGASNFGRGDGLPHLYDTVPILRRNEEQDRVLEKKAELA